MIEKMSALVRPTILDSYVDPTSYYAIHFHEALYAFIFYNLLFFASPLVCTRLFGAHYTSQTRRGRVNFDIHVVAMVQCLVSIAACLWLFADRSLGCSQHAQLFGYSYNHAFVAAATIGYFVWDLLVCLYYFDLFGFEFLFHAIASLFVFFLALIPFLQYWVPRFLIFELSSPFVNVNWFITKLPPGAVSTRFNVANGLLLMVSFFAVRVVWGFYAIGLVISLLYAQWGYLSVLLKVLASLAMLINFFLDVLNLFWFSKMIKIAKKMARGGKKVEVKKEK